MVIHFFDGHKWILVNFLLTKAPAYDKLPPFWGELVLRSEVLPAFVAETATSAKEAAYGGARSAE